MKTKFSSFSIKQPTTTNSLLDLCGLAYIFTQFFKMIPPAPGKMNSRPLILEYYFFVI